MIHRTIGERRSALGAQLAAVRIAHGKTQDDIAGAIGCSRPTVINFESGKSTPDLLQLEDMETFLGEDPIYRLKCYRNPRLYSQLEADADIDDIEAELIRTIKNELPPIVKRQLLFLFSHAHGRDPVAVMQECNAILQMPLRMGHGVAALVNSLYKMADAHGEITCPDAVKPDLDYWESAIDAGGEAALSGQRWYSVKSPAAEDK